VHIGFLTLEYPPLLSGGIGTSVRNLARALVRQGHRVTVLGWGHDRQFDDQGVSVQFERPSAPPKTEWLVSRLDVQRKLRRLVNEEGMNLVEAHDWCGPSAGISPGCPLVIRCNGSAVYFGHLLSEAVRPSVKIAEQLALTKADAVSAVSKFTADVTSHLFGLRRPVTVLSNGVELSQFDAASPDDVEPRTLLYVGTVVRKKGVIDLCRAFSRVVADMPDAKLVIVGRDAPDRVSGTDSTWNLCEAELSPAARARVELTGLQPYDKVRDVLRRAAVCVFPSHAEAMPLAWLEAMASAKPIVAYNIGWAPEVVEPDRTGLLAEAGNVEALAECVLHILRDPARGAAFGKAGRTAVETRFSSDIAAARSAEWYREVLAAC
jgi:glycosyltransferase involved in cell wall biosynthesis